jgi:tagaturonate reductase
VIEGDQQKARELPLHKANLAVIYTDNQVPYRTRKVRILNGAHTMTVLGAYLYGKNTVRECMEDQVISEFMKKGINDEVIPTLDLPEKELKNFASAVYERFSNPFIEHLLLSISLNSTSKFKVRVLPSLLEYYRIKNQLPSILTFSLAELIAFYKGDEIRDNVLIGHRGADEYKILDSMDVLITFRDLWSKWDSSNSGTIERVQKILGNSRMWGEDLTLINGLVDHVSKYLYAIESNGIAAAIKSVVQD